MPDESLRRDKARSVIQSGALPARRPIGPPGGPGVGASQIHEDSVPSVELLPKVARVFRLILKGGTCTRCVSAELGAPQDLIEQALGAIGRAFQLVRPAPESCALCGSPDDVVAPKTVTSPP